MVRTALPALALLVLACGDGPGTGPDRAGPDPVDDPRLDPGGDPSSPSPFPVEDEQAVLFAHDAPRDVIGRAEQALTVGLDGIAFASGRTGRLTTTGRVEIPSPGADPVFTPGSGPGLTVSFFDDEGARVELWIEAERLEGSGSSGADLLGGDHAVTARLRVDGRMDLVVASVRAGRAVRGSARGAVSIDEVDLDVDLAFTGERWSEVDRTGSSATTRLHTTGRVEGPGFAITVDERFEAETVTAGPESASSSTSQLASAVDVEGRTYELVGVRIQRAFRGGEPSDLDGFWTARGEVRRDGATVARYRLSTQLVDRREGQGFVLVELVTPRGTIELERWLVS